METTTYELRHPKTVKRRRGSEEIEEVVTEIHFRRPNGGDLRAIASLKGEMEIACKLFTRVGNINEVIFDALDLEDIQGGMELISDFLPQSLKAGKTS